jgi:glutaredoxin
MILLFTSDNCTWCDVLKGMLAEECSELNLSSSVHEINVSEHTQIAEVYEILVVPTLVAGHQKISGVPATDELRSFLMSALTTGSFTDASGATKSLFSKVRALRQEEAHVAVTPELAN